MRAVKQITKNTAELQDDDVKQIVDLHQSFFDLSADDIVTFMRHRDEVDMYYNRSGKLIGTVGIQRAVVDGRNIMYIGNAVIDKDYHGRGLLTRSLLRPVLRMFYKNMFRNSYVISFATSVGAYTYLSKYKYAWPKPFQPMPEYPRYLLETFLKEHYNDQYKPNENAFLINQKDARITSKTTESEPDNLPSLWFTLTNSDYKSGQQLPCIVRINLSVVLVLVSSGLVSIVRKKPLFARLSKLFRLLGKKDYFYWVIILAIISYNIIH